MALIKNTLIPLCILLVLSIGFSHSQSLDAARRSATFQNIDLKQALALASEQNKELLLFFTATWSAPCKNMERSVFSHDSIKNALSDYIALRIDVDTPAGQQLEYEFKVGTYPTVLIINSSSDVMKRNNGALRKKDFLKFITVHQEHNSTETADQK
jgi:thiol:disulfide interchange protein